MILNTTLNGWGGTFIIKSQKGERERKGERRKMKSSAGEMGSKGRGRKLWGGESRRRDQSRLHHRPIHGRKVWLNCSGSGLAVGTAGQKILRSQGSPGLQLSQGTTTITLQAERRIGRARKLLTLPRPSTARLIVYVPQWVRASCHCLCSLPAMGEEKSPGAAGHTDLTDMGNMEKQPRGGVGEFTPEACCPLTHSLPRLAPGLTWMKFYHLRN